MRILKIGFLFLFLSVIGEAKTPKIKYAVIISANTEWKMVKKRYPSEEFLKSPWGEYFFRDIDPGSKKNIVLFFHEGWGKVAAAGATQKD